MIPPSDFMDQAKKLVNDNTEVNLRTAVSRAYYSLYHESISFLEKNYRKQLIQKIKSILFSRPTTSRFDNARIDSLDKKYIASLMSMHELVKETYHYIKKNRFASEFKSKRDDRNFADYQIDQSLDFSTAMAFLNEVEQMIIKIRANQL